MKNLWSAIPSSVILHGEERRKPGLLLLLGIILVITSDLTSSSPTHAFNLESMSSAELEELASQFAAQDHEASLPSSSSSHHFHSPQLDSYYPAESSPTSLASSTSSNKFHVIRDCVTISMDEGVFHYKSTGSSEQVCGLYLVADPDKTITVTVEYLNVDCHQKGLISIVDGWELNGEVFPSIEDHEKSFESRFHELCGLGHRRHQQSYHSSQNAALIQYRIPVFGQGFSIRVQHVHNPRPCNILVQDTEGAYTLDNHGGDMNCSLTTLFDAKIRMMYVNVGQHGAKVKYSTGIQKDLLHKCNKMGLEDYVQLGGSSGLDSSKMAVVDEFCGQAALPSLRSTTVFCGMTTIRMVSSGKYHNKVVAEVRKADLDDIPLANYICGM